MDISPYVTRSAREPDFSDFMANLGKRHQVTRDGERPEIPQPLRWAIYIRDDYRCRSCAADLKGKVKHLDHIIPWSAGGPDIGNNLRTLCPDCNERRSNYFDGATGIRVSPVTWWCLRCWIPRERDADEPREHFCWLERERPDWWWKVPLIEATEGLTPAFCAHCRAIGHTDRPL